jgi:hypothetical protein
MSETINRRILDKIKNSDCDESVKQFLREVLVVELKNFEIGSHITLMNMNTVENAVNQGEVHVD